MHFSKSKVDSLDLSQIASSFISVNYRRLMYFAHVCLLVYIYINTVLVYIPTYCINCLNVLPSVGDGTTLPLGDIALISRAFGRLIPPFERDSLLVLAQDLAKEDKVAFTENNSQNLPKKWTNPGFSASTEKVSGKEGEIAKFSTDQVPV